MVLKSQKRLKNTIIGIYHHFAHIFKEITPRTTKPYFFSTKIGEKVN